MDPYQSIHSPSGQKQRASPTKCTSPTHREIDEYSKIKSPSLSDGKLFIICSYVSFAIIRILIYPDAVTCQLLYLVETKITNQ